MQRYENNLAHAKKDRHFFAIMNLLLLPFFYSVGIRLFVHISVKIALERSAKDSHSHKIWVGKEWDKGLRLLYFQLFYALLHIAVGLVEVALRDVDFAVDRTVGIAQRV